MDPRPLDTRLLRYFAEIVAQASITRAAGSLNVAQPALSLALRTLEERLGTRLLIRSSAGVTPTEAGALLALRARTILDDIARTEEEVRSLESDPAGAVRIGLPGTIGEILALPLIEAARARYPRITLTVAEAMSGFVADWLAEGRVDLAVLYGQSPAPGLAAEPLLEEELALLDAPGAALPEAADLADLAGRPMVLPSPAHGLRGLIDRAFAARGIRAEVAIEVDSYAAIKQLVAAGHGASILPRHSVRAEARRGALAVTALAAPGLWRSAALMTPTGRAMTRAQEVVRDLLRQTARDLVASGHWAGARPPG
ncbi:LysR family transcriptional regulator [Roseivivax sp. CAU 1761]